MSDESFVVYLPPRIHYEAGEISFDCICGAKELFLSEGGETTECRCGRVFKLVYRIEVKIKEVQDDSRTTSAEGSGEGA